MKIRKSFRSKKVKYIALIVFLASGAVMMSGVIRGSVIGQPSDANTVIEMVSAVVWLASWAFLQLNFLGVKKYSVILPDHEDMKGTRTCHICGGAMAPSTDSSTFHLKAAEVTVSGIKAYKCEKCGEVIYTSDEAKLIEEALNPFVQKEG